MIYVYIVGVPPHPPRRVGHGSSFSVPSLWLVKWGRLVGKGVVPACWKLSWQQRGQTLAVSRLVALLEGPPGSTHMQQRRLRHSQWLLRDED